MSERERQLDHGPNPAPEDLARLRNRLRVDRSGEFHYDDVRVIHPRTVRMLVEHMDLDAEGRCIVRVGRVWSYVRYDDTPLVVLDARIPERPDEPVAVVGLVLTGGVETDLDPSTLRIGDNDALYCRVRGGRLEARFVRAAHFRLASFVVDRSPEPFAFRLGGRTWPIAPRRTAGTGGLV